MCSSTCDIATERECAPTKPYCVKCPQVIMVLVVIAAQVALFCTLPIWGGLLSLALVCLAVITRSGRRIVFGRGFSSLLFACLLIACVIGILKSDEPWYTVPVCKEEVPIWNGCWRRDPGGEKAIYLIYASMFAVFAVMPWLPSGCRYYAGLKAKVNGECQISSREAGKGERKRK